MIARYDWQLLADGSLMRAVLLPAEDSR